MSVQLSMHTHIEACWVSCNVYNTYLQYDINIRSNLVNEMKPLYNMIYFNPSRTLTLVLLSWWSAHCWTKQRSCASHIPYKFDEDCKRNGTYMFHTVHMALYNNARSISLGLFGPLSNSSEMWWPYIGACSLILLKKDCIYHGK